MSNKTIQVDDSLHEYILSVSLREDPLLRELREETSRLKMARMQISPEQGQFMALLLKLTGARRYLEVGTFTGYSALKLAEGVAEDGEVITCDIDEETTAIARRHWAKSPHGKKIRLELGPALRTIENEPGPFDLVFIDADKSNYVNYWEACLPKMPSGGIILADNVLWSGRVLDPQKPDDHALATFNTHVLSDKRVQVVMLPIRDGVTIACKL